MQISGSLILNFYKPDFILATIDPLRVYVIRTYYFGMCPCNMFITAGPFFFFFNNSLSQPLTISFQFSLLHFKRTKKFSTFHYIKYAIRPFLSPLEFQILMLFLFCELEFLFLESIEFLELIYFYF